MAYLPQLAIHWLALGFGENLGRCLLPRMIALGQGKIFPHRVPLPFTQGGILEFPKVTLALCLIESFQLKILIGVRGLQLGGYPIQILVDVLSNLG